MSIPSVRYADLVFQPDLRAATRDDGAKLSLTRQERALILQLTERPHQLITRQQLLEGLGDLAGELSERNIDYLVNWLRKRLGDNARTPRFIATQYGEGYIWVADPIAVAPVSAFLLIGPVYGLGENEQAAAVVKRLGGHIGQALHGSRKVLCLPQWRFEPETASHIAHSLEISLWPEDGQLHMALVLKDGRSNTPIRPFRLTVPLAAKTPNSLPSRNRWPMPSGRMPRCPAENRPTRPTGPCCCACTMQPSWSRAISKAGATMRSGCARPMRTIRTTPRWRCCWR